jgi:hypothetical protein
VDVAIGVFYATNRFSAPLDGFIYCGIGSNGKDLGADYQCGASIDVRQLGYAVCSAFAFAGDHCTLLGQ